MFSPTSFPGLAPRLLTGNSEVDCGLTVAEKDLCDLHIEDHAAISETVLRLVSTLDTPQTAPLARQLHAVLEDWLKHHIAIHDAELVRLIRQN